jgi:Predicted membrane protein
MSSKNTKHIVFSVISFLLLGMGISLQIKAGIGQSMFNAFSMLFADLFHFEIGTMINLFNLLFFVIYLFIKPTRPNRTDFMLIIATMANGYVINLFTYSIFAHVVISVYFFRIAIFLLGLLLASISLGAILAISILQFPLERLCIVLSQKLNLTLAKVRMGFDIFFFVSIIALTVLTNHKLYIREGTIISFFLLSRLMGFSYEFFKKN